MNFIELEKFSQTSDNNVKNIFEVQSLPNEINKFQVHNSATYSHWNLVWNKNKNFERRVNISLYVYQWVPIHKVKWYKGVA